MRDDWPEITDPALVRRLSSTEAELDAHLAEVAEQIGPSRPGPAYAERAYGYPWDRPEQDLLVDAAGAPHERPLEPKRAAELPASRWPLLAIGSNAAPWRLRAKLRGLRGPDAEVPLQVGWAQDLDIGALTVASIYGSFAATPLDRPGTRVRAAMLWVTGTQLERLTFSEISYHLVRLSGRPFTPDADAPTVDAYLLYVSRWGALRRDGEDVALAAIEAEGRTAPACTQQDLVAWIADQLLGPAAGPLDLLDLLASDYTTTRRRIHRLLGGDAATFAPQGMELHPVAQRGPRT